MVSHTFDELTAAGVPAEDIRYEQFHHVGAGDTDDDALSRSGDHQ
jgi:hypothetical protein